MERLAGAHWAARPESGIGRAHRRTTVEALFDAPGNPAATMETGTRRSFWFRMIGFFVIGSAAPVAAAALAGQYAATPIAPGGLILLLVMRVLRFWGADSTRLPLGWWVVGAFLVAVGLSAAFAAIPARLRWVLPPFILLVCANTYLGAVGLSAASY